MQGKRSPVECACSLLGSELTHLVKTPGVVMTSTKPSAHVKSAHMNGGTERIINSKVITECPVYLSSQNIPQAWLPYPKPW